MAGCGENGVDRFRVEPPVVGLLQQLCLCRRRLERRPVRPRLTHRRIAVGGGEDARRLIEGRPACAAVVAGAVKPLVVRAGQDPDRSELTRLREGALREVRVQSYSLPLSESKAPRFLPDRVRHADAAEVVRECGMPKERHGRRR